MRAGASHTCTHANTSMLRFIKLKSSYSRCSSRRQRHCKQRTTLIWLHKHFQRFSMQTHERWLQQQQKLIKSGINKSLLGSLLRKTLSFIFFSVRIYCVRHIIRAKISNFHNIFQILSLCAFMHKTSINIFACSIPNRIYTNFVTQFPFTNNWIFDSEFIVKSVKIVYTTSRPEKRGKHSKILNIRNSEISLENDIM